MTLPTKITPFLWFDDNAEDAADFYASVFDDGKIVSTMPGPGGRPMGVTVRLAGREYVLFNGGPHFTLNESFSLMIDCKTQGEVDRLWGKLTEGGGEASRCGWLKDRFGLSWQVVPTVLGEMLADPDREKAGRVLQAMMGMGRIEIAQLESAYHAA